MSSLKSKLRVDKRDSIKLETKYQIIKELEKPNAKRKDILVKYNLKNQANITRILESKNEIIKAYESGIFKN